MASVVELYNACCLSCSCDAVELYGKKGRKPTYDGHSFQESLEDRATELRVEDDGLEVDKMVFRYKLIPSDLVPLEKCIQQKTRAGSRTKRIKMLGKSTPCLLKPVKLVTESGFQVLAWIGETGLFFSVTMSGCRHIPQAENMSLF